MTLNIASWLREGPAVPDARKAAEVSLPPLFGPRPAEATSPVAEDQTRLFSKAFKAQRAEFDYRALPRPGAHPPMSRKAKLTARDRLLSLLRGRDDLT